MEAEMSTRRKIAAYLENFGFDYHQPRDFVTLKLGPPKYFLVWASCWALYHTVWICAEGYYWSTRTYSEGRWFVFLTNLAYLSIALMSAVELAIAVYVNRFNRSVFDESQSRMTWYLRLQWILYNTAYSNAVLITPAFWIMLHEYKWPGTINKHGINTVFTILSLLITARPIKWHHAYIPMISSFAYMFFTYLYYRSGGNMIYSFLNWDKPGRAILWAFLCTFVGTPVAHMIVFGIHRLGIFLFNKYIHSNRNADQLDEESKIPMNDTKGVNKTEE